MNCFPSCEVSLPRIGKTYVSSKLDICKNPAILTLSITSDGKRSVSSFVAGNQQEYRTIGNDFWPLQLQVKFRNAVENTGYYTEACIQTVRTGNTTCFMNGYVDASADSGCNSYRSNNNGTGFPIIILCVILATCLLMISVAVVAMFHRLYTSQRASNSRKNSFSQSKNTTNGYPSFFDSGFQTTKFPHDERLAVIDEVDEKDHDSISIASSGFGSGHLKSVSEDECTRHTELSTDTKQMTSCVSEHRRQSQPLLDQKHLQLESFKPRSSLPLAKNPTHAIV
ncbi:hypothetical protein FO519_001746 [Halicephalobus sp. NKZ332]|nr:hypothetical protein FO519_001746 [Halicephalobus sp. NKZ332]